MTGIIKRYHMGSIVLHWMIGLMLISNLVLGLLLEDIPDDQKFQMYQLHKSLGISVFLLTFVRIFWRFIHPAPHLPTTLKVWETWAVKITHLLFYVLMLVLPFSGWALVSASPRNIPTVLFGIIPWPNLPFFEAILDIEQRKQISETIGDVHGLMAYIMLALLALHIAAALRHHFMIKDETLLRMTPKFMDGLLQRLRGKKA